MSQHTDGEWYATHGDSHSGPFVDIRSRNGEDICTVNLKTPRAKANSDLLLAAPDLLLALKAALDSESSGYEERKAAHEFALAAIKKAGG